LTLGGQALVFRAVRRRSATATAALVAALALPPITIAAGVLTWLPTDYPHFLVEDARARMGLPEGPIPCYGKRLATVACCGTGRPAKLTVWVDESQSRLEAQHVAAACLELGTAEEHLVALVRLAHDTRRAPLDEHAHLRGYLVPMRHRQGHADGAAGGKCAGLHRRRDRRERCPPRSR
jgi:hypothetical protein